MKRTKRRYLALKVDSKATLTAKQLIEALWNAVTRLYGEYGASLTGLKLIDFNEEKKTAVIRTSLKTLRMVRTAIALITSFANQDAALHTTAVSGTIKSLREKQA